MNNALFSKNGYDCIDYSLSLIFGLNGIEYEWVLSKSWGISFENGLSPKRKNRFELMDELLGVHVYEIWTSGDGEEYLKKLLVDREKESLYLLVDLDCYYLPWDRLYNQIHGEHYVYLKICDSSYILYDKWYNVEKRFSFGEICSILRTCYVVDFSDYVEVSMSTADCVKLCYDHYRQLSFSSDDIINYFENIDVPYLFENCNKEEYTKAPVMRQLKEIVYNHLQTANYFRFLSDKYSDKRLYEVSVEFSIAAQNIENVRNEVAKSFLYDTYKSEIIVDEIKKFLSVQKLVAFILDNYLKTDALDKNPMVKCVAWDLDNTLWDGTLDSGLILELKPSIRSILEGLYSRGIPCIVVSKNDHSSAYNMICRLNVEKYFIDYFINWDSKWKSIKKFAEKVNISVASILFVDDSNLELFECKYNLPDVQIYDAENYTNIIDYINQDVPITLEAQKRVDVYKSILKRKESEDQLGREDFLKMCNIEISITEASDESLDRIVELSERTHIFNMSGEKYTKKRLQSMERSNIYTASLKDVFGDYGIVGAFIISRKVKCELIIEFLTVSCKVEGRNIGQHLLDKIINIACQCKCNRIIANFRNNNKNERMRILLSLNGFSYDNVMQCYKYCLNENNKKIANNVYYDEDYIFIKDAIYDAMNSMNVEDKCIDGRLSDLFDSVNALEFICRIEEKIGITIPLNENIETISKFLPYVYELYNSNGKQ